MLNNNFPMTNTKNLTDDEKQKWREIMIFLKQNPEVLLEIMPEGMEFDFRAHNKSAYGKQGQVSIPDLGVVPPQAESITKQRQLNDSSAVSNNINQNHSFGESKFSSDSYQKQSLYHISNTFTKPLQGEELLTKPHNTPNNNNKMWNSNISKKNMKPGTAANRTVNEYQTPSFLTSNIVNTVNKTVYKVSKLSHFYQAIGKSGSIRQ